MNRQTIPYTEMEYGEARLKVPDVLITAHKREMDIDHYVEAIEYRSCDVCNDFWESVRDLPSMREWRRQEGIRKRKEKQNERENET